ncbi:MAG: methyltransferase domain-containing protein [Candidatus Bathyarchaeota archaeon]|nr:methyltransferase domain-containing protein [Candidatus Bathyarchaeota archaeon]
MSYDYSKKSGKAFSKIANEYDKGRRGENVELWGAETKSLAGLTEESRVLDLGCGTGLYTVGVGREAECQMLGMDPVPGMLGQAREKSKDVHWFNGIGEWLPLRDGVLDSIFSSQVWHHIVDKQGTACECGRTLKEKGSVVIRTIGHAQLHEKVVFKYFPEIKPNQLNVYPSNEEFEEYFGNAGFGRVEFHEYSEERYQSVEEFVEIAEKKLWSMFRPITEEGLRQGVEDLWRYKKETGRPVRNDELITLVVCRR